MSRRKIQRATGTAANRKTVRSLLRWFSANARDLPWRRTSDPYAIWVSEVMLQQTQVKTVMPYWKRWMQALPTIKSLARAKPEKIHKLWEGLGYYTRVRNMQKAAQQIMTLHGGNFPREYEAILALPGIGRYTAGAIASIAFNQPKPILDGNVIRVLTRLHGIAKNPREKSVNEKLWRLSEELVLTADRVGQRACRPEARPRPVPPALFQEPKVSGKFALTPALSPRRGRSNARLTEVYDVEGAKAALVAASQITNGGACSHLNQSLMELGALICTPKQPKCPVCPLRLDCVAHREDSVAQIPNLGKPAAATERRFTAFVLEDDGRFLVRQRPAGVVNAHLWEFPNIELFNNGHESISKHAVLAVPGTRIRSWKKLCSIRHSITRYRITLEAFHGIADNSGEPKAQHGRWSTLTELKQLAFPSAHRRILERLVHGPEENL